jgi:hypothetical protein
MKNIVSRFMKDESGASDGSTSPSRAPGHPGPLSYPADRDGVTMRKPDAASVAAAKASLPAGGRGDAPVQVVCIALALAIVVLAARIVSIW